MTAWWKVYMWYNSSKGLCETVLYASLLNSTFNSFNIQAATLLCLTFMIRLYFPNTNIVLNLYVDVFMNRAVCIYVITHIVRICI